ncbi:hypothetical protein GH714_011148 [Hevea brasiliensis]|uniref:Glutaredoxin domain-containing protein n=1 Tax=Hevea brasiliensis TaxID=3981 RepID=A0A6A6MI63_HEVBR|nr:hypothetical protein GH714_011148 [Hevea brasiliensis]
MGCSSSKRIEATVDIYRPPPSSFAVFDINSIQEPWLSVDNSAQENQEKPTHLPAPILEKLKKLESDAPHSWEEVSKALEELNNKNSIAAPLRPGTVTTPAKVSTTNAASVTPTPKKTQTPLKSSSFHTLEELDAKLSSKPQKELRKAESMRTELKKPEATKTESRVVFEPETESENVIKPIKKDPLSDYPEKCPPGGADSVVIYTTSLRGVLRTYENCNHLRALLEVHRVVFDERDVSLHGEFLKEIRELLGEDASVPRAFVKGRYIGGVEEVLKLNESDRLGRILSWARVERGVGRQGCEGCGGARFVPCLECGGSCKVLVDGVRRGVASVMRMDWSFVLLASN